MEFSNGKIILKKKPSELDKLVFDFAGILQQYTDYVIVSGYVAIILGRIRGTDDIDVIIPRKTIKEFKNIIKDLTSKGYWCINAYGLEEMHSLLKTGHSIRIAKNREISPNFEMKFAKTESDSESLNRPTEIFIKGRSIKIGPLELQIAYKEIVLKSEKDLEDAKHIRIVAEEYIDGRLVGKYKKRLREWMKKRQ